ncbi:hypothetical protein [Mesorhizobium sp. B2-1-2]|uniref:hypothetical protein n=1 Tax=Mesorhizobium sp. B2-1-2 TaxID=2589973 RepID=UPI00112C6EF5|nr:hypothetical protein [Mesorhizobium sp. B2-1-2]TPN04487.1 hypothetical protein FJ971_29520 [Mesorhizobium sp. B2-1-2]
MQQFEFHAYQDDGFTPEITTEQLRGEAAARSKAGRMAKLGNGPVDLAYAGSAPWNERYITTASPSEFHASGYRFLRLD